MPDDRRTNESRVSSRPRTRPRPTDSETDSRARRRSRSPTRLDRHDRHSHDRRQGHSPLRQHQQSRHHDRSRKRQRSPEPFNEDRERRQDRQQVCRQDRPDRKRSRSRDRCHPKDTDRLVELPFGAPILTKHDWDEFRPLLAAYLRATKGKELGRMEAWEVKGRWKRFYGKWNRGELTESWYDPDTYDRAYEEADNNVDPLPKDVAVDIDLEEEDDAVQKDRQKSDVLPSDMLEANTDTGIPRVEPGRAEVASQDLVQPIGQDSGSEDEYGPLPVNSDSKQHGVALPTVDELQHLHQDKRTAAQEAQAMARAHQKQDRQQERKRERERLDELVPRADAGTHERRQEKKREVTEKLRSFRDPSPPSAAAEDDNVLLGGGRGGDDLAALKAERDKEQRKKTERQIRREAFERARTVERQDRIREYQEKEDRVVGMLRELARKGHAS